QRKFDPASPSCYRVCAVHARVAVANASRLAGPVRQAADRRLSMSITISCPHCDHQYTLADTLKGKTIRCKRCEETFVVGKARPPRRDEDENGDEDRPRRRKTKQGGVPVWLWLAGGGGLLVAAAAVIVIILLNSGSGDGGDRRDGGGSPTAEN